MKWLKAQWERERVRQAAAILVGVGLGNAGLPIEVARALGALVGVLAL